MAALNVMPPDAVTRVTDYVPEIVSYIERIASNGYCYEAGGSVYFDTAAFRAAEGKVYGKVLTSCTCSGSGRGSGSGSGGGGDGGSGSGSGIVVAIPSHHAHSIMHFCRFANRENSPL